MKFDPAVYSLILLVSCVSLFAQQSVATKIDEFGNTNCDNYRARFDASLTELREHPNAKAYVYVYDGDIEYPLGSGEIPAEKGATFVPSEIGFAKDVIGYLKTHVLFRNMPADNLMFLNAGFRQRFSVEVWLVPTGVEPPKPTPTHTKITQRKRSKKPYGFCGEM